PFSFSYFGHHRRRPSFPTRRSSDLDDERGVAKPARHRARPAGEDEPCPRPRRCQERNRVGGETPRTPGVAGKEVEETFGHSELGDRKSTRLNSSHVSISYAVFCLKK